jgi:hypothetical protein
LSEALRRFIHHHDPLGHGGRLVVSQEELKALVEDALTETREHYLLDIADLEDELAEAQASECDCG